MIKICKQKAIDRWTKIGKGFWYSWNLSFFPSIIYFCYGLIPQVDLNNILWTLSMVNMVMSGVWSLTTDGSVYVAIREKQKLFGWNEDC